MNTANAEGTVGAINSWKEIAAQNAKRADDERTARLAAEARADEIAKERNAALQQVWVLTGQVEILTKQLAELQKKVAAMEGNGNAKQ
ncbi:hypothetical protein D3C87_1608620 [compost metagenome]